MSRFEFCDTPLLGLKVVKRQVIGDARGFLSRIFCENELAAVGWSQPVSQINHTYTSLRGTVRGMHYQNPPHAEAKLVSCLNGTVLDVAVDIRAGSKTFGQHYALELSADNHTALLIPEGFAHGFQALTDHVHMLYCHSAAYAAQAEGGLNSCDPALDIKWPLEIAEISPRDKSHPMLTPDFQGLEV